MKTDAPKSLTNAGRLFERHGVVTRFIGPDDYHHLALAARAQRTILVRRRRHSGEDVFYARVVDRHLVADRCDDLLTVFGWCDEFLGLLTVTEDGAAERIGMQRAFGRDSVDLVIDPLETFGDLLSVVLEADRGVHQPDDQHVALFEVHHDLVRDLVDRAADRHDFTTDRAQLSTDVIERDRLEGFEPREPDVSLGLIEPWHLVRQFGHVVRHVRRDGQRGRAPDGLGNVVGRLGQFELGVEPLVGLGADMFEFGQIGGDPLGESPLGDHQQGDQMDRHTDRRTAGGATVIGKVISAPVPTISEQNRQSAVARRVRGMLAVELRMVVAQRARRFEMLAGFMHGCRCPVVRSTYRGFASSIVQLPMYQQCRQSPNLKPRAGGCRDCPPGRRKPGSDTWFRRMDAAGGGPIMPRSHWYRSRFVTLA